MDNAIHLLKEPEPDVRKSVGTLLGSELSLDPDPPTPNEDNGKSSTRSSMFGGSECGEPLSAQHLVIDFTHNEELDTEYVQKKCCAFWEFINSHPELNHLCAMPEPDEVLKTPEDSRESSSSETEAEGFPQRMDRTAVSMLSLVEHKDLISRAFEPKLCQTHCTLGSREYVENEANKPAFLSKCACARAATCHKQCKAGGRDQEPDAADAQALCTTMEEWDLKHPKSMEPPGAAPTLIHAVMQRKIEPFS